MTVAGGCGCRLQFGGGVTEAAAALGRAAALSVGLPPPPAQPANASKAIPATPIQRPHWRLRLAWGILKGLAGGRLLSSRAFTGRARQGSRYRTRPGRAGAAQPPRYRRPE